MHANEDWQCLVLYGYMELEGNPGVCEHGRDEAVVLQKSSENYEDTLSPPTKIDDSLFGW